MSLYNVEGIVVKPNARRSNAKKKKTVVDIIFIYIQNPKISRTIMRRATISTLYEHFTTDTGMRVDCG